MLSIFLGILTFGLIVVSLFLILVVLAQKAKSDGGVGAAMGGGMAEAAFGADTSNVLSRSTIWAAICFFTFGLTLFLGRIYERNHTTGGGALPTIVVPMTPKAATSTLPAMPGVPATGAMPATSAPAPAAGAMAPATAAPVVPAAPAPAK